MTELTYTTEQAARRLGIPAGRIADWKHRGRIVPAGYLHGRGDGIPVYLLEDLMPLAEQWAKRGATRPKKG